MAIKEGIVMMNLTFIKFIYSVCIGTGGILILTLFGSLVFPDEQLFMLLPWIVGLNALITGYSLLEKMEGKLGLALFQLVGASVLIILPFPFIINQSTYFLFNISTVFLLLLLVISSLATFSGGWLAVQYQSLKASQLSR